MSKKIAVIFYGLTRSLSKTINSLKENLFNNLTKRSIDYDIFIHTYKINGVYYNCWSNEYTNNYYNEDVQRLLNPKYYIYDNQEDVINSINFYEYYSNLGDWLDPNNSPEKVKYLIKNMCLALYSKKKITKLFEKYKNEYNYAIIIRPDLFLKNQINFDCLDKLDNKNIFIPESEWFWGVNDKLCIASVDVIIYYGTLFDDLKEYSKIKSINSENYLKDKLIEKGIKINKLHIEYDIIRIQNDILRIYNKPYSFIPFYNFLKKKF
jgi:hypothetical protein